MKGEKNKIGELTWVHGKMGMGGKAHRFLSRPQIFEPIIIAELIAEVFHYTNKLKFLITAAMVLHLGQSNLRGMQLGTVVLEERERRVPA